MENKQEEIVLKDLLKKKNIEPESLSIAQLDELLANAAYDNDFPLAKALLLCSKTKPNINGNQGRILGYFVLKDNIEAVKFLLTDERLEKKADIHYDSERALAIALDSGHLDIVKYLLLSQDLKDKADIHNRRYDLADRRIVEYIFRTNKTDKIIEIVDFLTSDYCPVKNDYRLYDKLFYLAKHEDKKIINVLIRNLLDNLVNLYDNSNLTDEKNLYKKELEIIMKNYDAQLLIKFKENYQLNQKLVSELEKEQKQEKNHTNSTKLKV